MKSLVDNDRLLSELFRRFDAAISNSSKIFVEITRDYHSHLGEAHISHQHNYNLISIHLPYNHVNPVIPGVNLMVVAKAYNMHELAHFLYDCSRGVATKYRKWKESRPGYILQDYGDIVERWKRHKGYHSNKIIVMRIARCEQLFWNFLCDIRSEVLISTVYDTKCLKYLSLLWLRYMRDSVLRGGQKDLKTWKMLWYLKLLMCGYWDENDMPLLRQEIGKGMGLFNSLVPIVQSFVCSKTVEERLSLAVEFTKMLLLNGVFDVFDDIPVWVSAELEDFRPVRNEGGSVLVKVRDVVDRMEDVNKLLKGGSLDKVRGVGRHKQDDVNGRGDVVQNDKNDSSSLLNKIDEKVQSSLDDLCDEILNDVKLMQTATMAGCGIGTSAKDGISLHPVDDIMRLRSMRYSGLIRQLYGLAERRVYGYNGRVNFVRVMNMIKTGNNKVFQQLRRGVGFDKMKVYIAIDRSGSMDRDILEDLCRFGWEVKNAVETVDGGGRGEVRVDAFNYDKATVVSLYDGVTRKDRFNYATVSPAGGTRVSSVKDFANNFFGESGSRLLMIYTDALLNEKDIKACREWFNELKLRYRDNIYIWVAVEVDLNQIAKFGKIEEFEQQYKTLREQWNVDVNVYNKNDGGVYDELRQGFIKSVRTLVRV